MGASVDLSWSNLCREPEFCVVKVATLVASLLASFFLLATAGNIIMKRLSRRPETPIGRLVDNLVMGLCLLDSTYYLPCLLVVLQGPASPLLMLHTGHESGGRVSFIYPHCREAVMMLDILWHCYVAHVMYCWIVLKHSVPRLQKNFNPLLITVLGLLLVTLYVLLDNFFWRAYGLAGLAYGAIVVNILVFPACVIFVLRAYFKTVRALRTGAGDDTFVPERYLRTRRKLLIICATMSVTWTLGPLADMVVWAYILINDIQAAPMMFYPVRLITCRVIGIMDALILAGMFDFCCLRNVVPNTTPMIKALSMLPLFRKDEMESEPCTRDNSDERSTALLSPIMGEVKAKIFVTSWNMCGANSSRLVTKASLPQWIPAQGYDVYVVVVQEAAFAGELCRAIGRHLGGPSCFTLFSSVVGDARLPDGILAVLVWCRVDIVARGGVQIMTYDATAEGVKGGNRPNTGKLGVSLRLFDTTIALIGTNFRADVKGYNRLHQRNEDSKQALREVFVKDKAMNAFDAHLKHHHTLLIGGLNYRLMCVPEDVLDLVAESARQEAVSFTLESGEDREAAAANSAHAIRAVRGEVEVEEEPLWHAINYQRKLFIQDHDDLNMEEEPKPAAAAAAEVGECPAGSTGVSCLSSVPLCGMGPKVPYHRNSWSWVKDQDELLQCQVLEGLLETFREGPICFPPTYRWRPDRGAYMDYRSVDDLKQAFSIRGKEYAVKRAAAPNDRDDMEPAQSTSHRTPSYTDRVLFHSLEGREDRLRLLAYDMCETVYGSDHKPICAAFELTVDMSAVADSARVLNSLRDNEGQLYMYSIELCNFRFDVEEWSVAQLDRVAMGFPLENEDLLLAERERSNPLEGWVEGIPESLLKQAMETVTVWPWTTDSEKASRHYFHKVVMVMEGVGMARWANQHVVLKFADREGKCLGQGTFELPTVQDFTVYSHGSGMDETKDSNERDDDLSLGRGSSSPVIQEVVLPLSSAGTRRGSVLMEARVTRTPVNQKKRSMSMGTHSSTLVVEAR